MVKAGDLVILKAKPNSGEMVVEDVKPRYVNFPDASEKNPVVLVRFWDESQKQYLRDSFYLSSLNIVD